MFSKMRCATRASNAQCNAAYSRLSLNFSFKHSSWCHDLLAAWKWTLGLDLISAKNSISNRSYVNWFRHIIASTMVSHCQHCTEFENHWKVSFNIASEASYVYILSGQKLIKNAKNGPFWRVFWKPEAWSQTVVPDSSALVGQKLVENAKIEIQHFE